MINNKQLRTDFDKFMRRFPYEIWMTVTFRKSVSVSTAKKQFKHFLKTLNSKNTIFYHKYIRLWIFYEQNKVRDGMHIHALIDGIDTSKCQLLEQKCCIRFGESKVTAGHKNVIPYVSQKYNSPSLLDFDYYKINARLRK